MLMLSVVGWINGITAIIDLTFGIILGIVIIYQSKKYKAKLLFYAGIMLFSCWLIYLGTIIDFFTILLTGHNLDNTTGIAGILFWIWFPPAMIFGIYVILNLLLSDKKILKLEKISLIQIIISILICASIIVELFVILDPFSSFTFSYPSTPGEDLIDVNLIGIPFVILIITAIILLPSFVIGLNYKGSQLPGVLKKKYLILSFALSFYIPSLTIEAIFNPGIFLIAIRFFMFCCALCWFLGLREEPIKKEKKEVPEKEVKVEKSLFRLYERPAHVTEEEVVYHKEQEICLVCKGKTSRLTYICPDCKALYCVNCSEALTNLENMCWVCSTPIDPSKPSNLFEKEGEGIRLDNLEKDKKSDPTLNKL